MKLVMKKSILLCTLLSSLVLLSIGIGCFRANAEMKPAEADTFKIEMVGDTISVGSYPQNIVSIEEGNSVKEKNAPSNLDGDIPSYKYNHQLYSPIEHCRPYTGGAIMSTGEYGSQIFDQERWFIWQPITWTKFNTSGNITYFYANLVLDARNWQSNIDGQYISGTTTPANDWENSEIRLYLNDFFYDTVFSFDEQQALVTFAQQKEETTSNKIINDRVGLLPKSILSKNTNLLNARGTDFAMAKSMQYNLDGTMTTAYYYLNSNENDPTNYAVVDIATGQDLTKTQEVRVTTIDCKCGIRPFIAIDNSYLKTKKSGGGSSSGSSTPIKVNATLIIAIIFSVLGMAGVIAFLALWHKGVMITIGHTKGPIWMMVFVCLFAVLCLVGIGMIFGSTLGGIVGKGYKETDVVGYWSTPEFTLDTNDPEFGYSYYYGLAKDHTVYRYYADKWEGSVNNPQLRPYSGTGTWEIKNNKLIITASSNWRLFNWEEQVTTYYATDGFGFGLHGSLKNEGNQNTDSHVVSGYRWYHGSTQNPTGESIYLKNTGWTY